MKKHAKKILRNVFLAIILISLISTWYINRSLAPTKLKDFLIKNISQVIDRPVYLKEIHFNLINGFILKDLTIYEPDGKNVFIKIERLSTTLLFIPLLRERAIIIPSIHISSPLLNIVKNQDNTWNFLNPQLLKKESVLEKPKKKGFSILVQRIRFESGRINFSDTTRSPPYAKQLTNLEGNVTLSQKGTTYFKTIGRLNIPEKTAIALDGSYTLKENLLEIKTAVKNLPLLEPYNYFYKIGLFTNLKSGIADVLLNLKIDKDKKIVMDINSSVKNLDISCSGITLKGDINVVGISDLSMAETLQANYKIDLDLKGPTLRGVYLLNEISNLIGVIKISNEGISCDHLGGIAYNTPIRFSGGIKDLKDPQLRATIEADLDLLNYKNFLSEDLKAKFKDVDLQGLAEIYLKFYDILRDPQPASIQGNIKLKEAALKAPLIPNKVENCSGNISFENDLCYVSRISFNYGEKACLLDAKITNLKSPDVRMKLENPELSLNTRFQVGDDGIHILRATGKYINSPFNIAGDITDLKDPEILMQGNLALDLVDAQKFFPKIREPLTRFDIKGMCNLEFYLNGPCKKPMDLETVIKGQSNRITVWNLKFDEVKLDLRMKEKHLLIPEFSAKPYDGTFVSKMEMDLTQPNPPYLITMNLEGMNLSKLVLDTDLKNKPISGKAMTKLNIRGYGKNLETIKGEGSVLIKGGYLWEIPLLRGLADLLFMPNLSSIVFDEASANFIIANKNISTADLKFHSQNVNLLGEGGVNFDGNVDLLIIASISENFIKGPSEFARLAGILLSEAGQFIGDIRITGTLKKPEYKFIPTPIDKILKDKLKGLLGGFF